jgi:hypothetical protein
MIGFDFEIKVFYSKPLIQPLELVLEKKWKNDTKIIVTLIDVSHLFH